MAVRATDELNGKGLFPTQEKESFAQLWQLAGEMRDYRRPRRGEVLEGVVVRIDHDGVWVDVGTKAEGVIPSAEMRSLGASSPLEIGEQVLVYVIQPENQEGQIILSVDRAQGERAWRDLQQSFNTGESLEVEVVDYNKGGLLANVAGLRGFIPTSQLAGGRPASSGGQDLEARLATYKGSRLRVKVIEVNRKRNRLILSERAALADWRLQRQEKLLAEIEEGQIRQGRVTSLCDFGIFIDLGGADGLCHLSELSWNRVRRPEEVAQVGAEVEVYVLSVDREAERIALSLRRAHPEPWERLVERFELGELLKGTITKLALFGAFARVEDGMEGLIHISELADHHIAHPKEVVKEGDEVTLKIVRIDPEHYRLGLSLKQARRELEAQGAENPA